MYLRLYEELNARRFHSDAANAAVEQIGAPARVIRAMTFARRHAWASTRTELRAAIEDREIAPIVEFVAGVGFYVARDYDLGVATLARAAARGRPGVAKQARMYAWRFATMLGYTQEAREFERALGRPEAAPVEFDADPQRAAAQAWALVFERGPAAAGEALDALLERWPEHPAIVGARVRLELLRGDAAAAAARLEALPAALRERLASERAALALRRGDFDEALVRTAHPGDDPQLCYLRGKSLLGRGELGEACELLEQARAALPRSVTIDLTLALARDRERPNDPGNGLRRRFEELLARAPALLSAAANELGEALWTDQGPLLEQPLELEILTRAEASLTAELDVANPSYRVRDGLGIERLRHAPRSDLHGPTQLGRLHADDRALIDHVDGLLVRALDIRPPRPEIVDSRAAMEVKRGGVWTPRRLTPAQIEQFLEDGFLVVPRAFDPAIAERWRADANRRLREEPHRWIRGYDPNDESRSLRGYSPDDPRTWTWGRVDLEGPETVVIEDFAPDVWATICDLLGGPDRIRTRTWTNYLIINFCADAHLGIDRPAPHWESWHIDDPSPMTRLDRIENGLVGIALFDRLLPASGNTWIAPDSVGRVARELAAHPEGVDFVSNRGREITMQCERFHEVVGEVGDVLLMHPLMMHSSSPNRSGRIRWMGNPMVYLNEPLDPFRPVEEMSPVELAIHRAIT